jgi:hypothetical protein
MLSIKRAADVPWKNVFHKSAWYTCYLEDDRYIFVPREKGGVGLITAIEGAYKLSTILRTTEEYAHQLIVRIGEAAGQEIDWPYLELIRIRGET